MPLLLACGLRELQSPEDDCARPGTLLAGELPALQITVAETLTTATVSNGNPDTADNVATLVPDATTTWQSLDTHMGRANRLVDTANEADDNTDEIVLVGNSGTSAQHASELRFPPANVHATTAKNDGITGLTDLTHGADPTNPEFGATVFDSNPGSSDGAWPLRDAHSEYFQEDNSSLEYMGEAISGQNKSD